MLTKRTGHLRHIVLMGGIIVAALWLGSVPGGVLLLALLACVAMMVAMVWMVARPTRLGVSDPIRADRPSFRRGERAAPLADRDD